MTLKLYYNNPYYMQLIYFMTNEFKTKEEFKKHFNKVLIDYDLTQTAFAEKLGKSNQTVYNWFHGITCPHTRDIVTIQELTENNINFNHFLALEKMKQGK